MFGKKESKQCPICGGETKLLSSIMLADGAVICENCAKMLRGKYNIDDYYKKNFSGDFVLKQRDALQGLSLEDVQRIIDEAKEIQDEVVEELGNEYTNLFQSDEALSIAPKALDVGLKRAKLLKNRCVLKGMVIAGEFNQGDSVTLLRDDEKIQTTILELIPATGNNLDNELKANMHEKTVGANTNAWFIIDIPGSEGMAGDKIVSGEL